MTPHPSTAKIEQVVDERLTFLLLQRAPTEITQHAAIHPNPPADPTWRGKTKENIIAEVNDLMDRMATGRLTSTEVDAIMCMILLGPSMMAIVAQVEKALMSDIGHRVSANNAIRPLTMDFIQARQNLDRIVSAQRKIG